jgi:hypothetical protein
MRLSIVGNSLEAAEQLLQKPRDPDCPKDNQERGHQRFSVHEPAKDIASPFPETGRLPLDAWGVSGMCHGHLLVPRGGITPVPLNKEHLERKDL